MYDFSVVVAIVTRKCFSQPLGWSVRDEDWHYNQTRHTELHH